MAGAVVGWLERVVVVIVIVIVVCVCGWWLVAKNEHTARMTSVERHLPTTRGEEQQ